MSIEVNADTLARLSTLKPAATSVEENTSRTAARPWLVRWPSNAALGSRLWDPDAGTHVVPVLLIFRSGDRRGHGAGVDVLMPTRSYARQVWLRCVYAGARTLGFRDRHALHTEAGLPDFPFDYPETAAGEADAAALGAASLHRYQRRPPAKRVNFDALAVACPHSANWHLAASVGSPSRPEIMRLPPIGAAGCIQQAGYLIAVTLRCPGRGAPKRLSHLFRPHAGDFPVLTACVHRACGVRRAEATWTEPPTLPRVPWEQLRLEEPLHKALKRRRAQRREAEEAQRALAEGRPRRPGRDVTTLRPLVGFVTSGCFSQRQGCGAGVGAVGALALAEVLRDQLEQRAAGAEAGSGAAAVGTGDLQELARHWVLLWARNTTSLVYFPVWVRALESDAGLG